MVLQSGLLCAAAGRTSAVFFNGLSLKNQASGAESETALTWKRVRLEYTEPGPPDVLTSREACFFCMDKLLLLRLQTLQGIPNHPIRNYTK